MRNLLKRVLILMILCFLTQIPSFAYEFDTSFSKNETIYKSSSARINYINPTAQDNPRGGGYPGYRGANQLIIYTPEYGRKTGTNEFGTEAIVVNGYVTSLSGADSLIPYNGFVISGHGMAKEWINKNVTLGSKIIVSPNTMVVTSALTPESYLFAANAKIKEVFSLMRYYSHQNVPYDYTSAVEYLNKSKKALSQAAKQPDNIKKYSSTAINNANKAIEYSMPYYKDELKGVWLRPTQRTKSEIESALDKLKEEGINNIFLETFYHAKTIYPSEVLSRYNITNQRQEFVGFDPLMVWVTEAHKRKMKIHIWFECFYVGNDNPNINPHHILNVYPQWANTTREKYNSKNIASSAAEHNGYFLDPANPAVQTFLLEVLNEIITKYEPDGINLDYIRYPLSVDKKSANYENSNWGYTQFARDEFMQIYGIDPVNISKNTRDWDLWSRYRQEKITNFVIRAKDLIHRRAILTTVIFPDRQRSLDTKMQDWRTWSHKNYIDGFTPLLLTCDYDTAKSLLQDIKSNSSKFTDIYAGIFVSFMNGSTDDLLRQIHMSRELKAKGVIIFDHSHFKSKYAEAVSESAFTPLSDRTLRKIKSGEISQKKLQEYLDKSIKEFYKDEAAFNKAVNNKSQGYKTKIDEQKNIKEVSNISEQNKPNNNSDIKETKQKKKSKYKIKTDESMTVHPAKEKEHSKKKPAKTSPQAENKTGEKGRFY